MSTASEMHCNSSSCRKGVDVSMWDLEKRTRIWSAKNVSYLTVARMSCICFCCRRFSAVCFLCHPKIWWVRLQPRRDNLGLIAPAYVTALAFLSDKDHRKFVVGTGHHQV